MDHVSDVSYISCVAKVSYIYIYIYTYIYASVSQTLAVNISVGATDSTGVVLV